MVLSYSKCASFAALVLQQRLVTAFVVVPHPSLSIASSYHAYHTTFRGQRATADIMSPTTLSSFDSLSSKITTTAIHMIDPFHSSSIMQAVEIFDGSTITDPVVVSDIFWSSLKTNILSVIIGQALASIVFVILTYLLSTQLSNIGDYVSKNVFKESVVKKSVDDIAQAIKERS